ncbi:AzlD domain-containing protein [Marivibrio halodurans]|uniref:AzlD domain-containing protein n=1 Tax=Marivibrio halodurans TaxID=2039722 RepID=A0A8J7V3V9_9PROT|nr:AzlD domain-containing protein [Marivibrio halodurans]MBP5858795.1 AzlD domain-containing protein [Marivibrio halodurans]
MVEPLHGWGLMLLAVLATFVWRFAGVLVAGRITEDGRLFAWIAAVAYAMVAALMARVVLMPRGDTAWETMWPRALALAVGFVLWRLAGKRLVIGLAGGVAAFAVLVALGY